MIAAREEREQRSPERVGRSGVGQEHGIEWREKLGRRADRRTDDGRATGEALERHEPEAFEVARGHHRDVGRRVVRGQHVLGHEAGEADGGAETETRGMRAQRRRQRPIAAHHEHGRRVSHQHRRHRVEQQLHAHPRLEVAETEEQGPVERQAESAAHCATVRRRNEARAIDAPGNHANGAWRQAMRRRDAIRHEATERAHAPRAGEHARFQAQPHAGRGPVARAVGARARGMLLGPRRQHESEYRNAGAACDGGEQGTG